MFNVVLAHVDYFQDIIMLSKLSWVLFLLTIKIFKDDKNLLANVTFPYKTLIIRRDLFSTRQHSYFGVTHCENSGSSNCRMFEMKHASS